MQQIIVEWLRSPERSRAAFGAVPRVLDAVPDAVACAPDAVA